MDDVMLVGEGLGRRIGARWLWRGLSFVLKGQERIVLVGPSGSGKTSLLRALAGLDTLEEGRLLLEGRPAESWKASEYRARVMYLHQRPALLPGSVADNFRTAFALKAHGARVYDPSRARDLLASLGRAPEFLEQDSSKLSGGEGQIVALIRALLLDPEILLLDEPTSSLDAATTSQVEQLLSAWLDAGPRRACMWASHDPAQIVRVATRTIQLGGEAA